MPIVKSDKVPPWKRDEKLDTIICHWVQFAPGRSGMYETVKELVKYENRIPGVLAGIVEPMDTKDCIEGGKFDPIETDIVTQSHNWAYQDANIHMIHYSATPYGIRLKPRIFMIHGSFEASLYSELDPSEHKFHSLTTAINFMETCDASICIHKRQYYFFKQFDHSHKLSYVRRGVDLERWKPDGLKADLNGKPAVMYAEVWRHMKDPIHTFFAAYEYFKKNQDMRFHPFNCTDYHSSWERVVFAGGFHAMLGKYGVAGNQAFLEHYFRSAHMLISPIMIGENSRVSVEAMACGCPVITWDTDNFGDFQAVRKAKPFDVFSLAECMESLWDEMKNNEEKVRNACVKYARENFDMAQTAQLVVKICRQVLKEVKA